MKLLLVRHGKTIENQQNILTGHLPGHLSEEGMEHAKHIASELKDKKIDMIYSSDLTRAIDTTKEIIKFHKDIQVEYTIEMRERYLGEIQGKKMRSEDVKKSYIFTNPVGGESEEEMFNRAKKFLNKIFEKHENQTILLVGHNGINKAIIAVIRKLTYKDIPNIEDFSHTDVKTFELKDLFD